MKTAYYTYTSWEEAMASGFGGTASRQGTLVREPEQKAQAQGGGKVIDLNAWRAANRSWAAPEEELADWPRDDGSEAVEPELVFPAPRPRRDHRRALFAAELASTLAVVGAAAALVLRVLLF